MNHPMFLWPELLAATSANRGRASQLLCRGPLLHGFSRAPILKRTPLEAYLTCSFHAKTVSLRRQAAPELEALLCQEVPSALTGAQRFSTASAPDAARQDATSLASNPLSRGPPQKGERKEAVCILHPLEGFLSEKRTSRAWLQLLRETCAGQALPCLRLWGGSYREVVPTALPPSLRLCMSVSERRAETAKISSGNGGRLPTASSLAATEGCHDQEVSSNELNRNPSVLTGSTVPRQLLLGLLRAVGATHLLPVQQFALPLLLDAQSDVLLAAPAGSGKTLATAVAVFSHLLSEWSAPSDPRGCVRAVVVTPTRDMAVQTRNLLTSLGRYSPLRVEMLLGRAPGEAGGGGAPWRCFSALQTVKPHVLICTPGKTEEFVQFLLAAEETAIEETRQVPRGISDLLASCTLLVVEDANLQLQEPLMLRAVAKLKELLPPGHKCIMLASSLSWSVQSCAMRLMRMNSICLNCIEVSTPPATVSSLAPLARHRLSSPQLPSCTEAVLPTSATSNASAHKEAISRANSLAAAADTQLATEASSSSGKNTSSGAGEDAAELTRCDITAPTLTQTFPCIRRLDQPQPLWGPKRSGEFLAKKFYELSLTSEGTPESLNYLITRGTQLGLRDSLRRPDEILLYPPELHGHFLFNVLAHEALLAARGRDEASCQGPQGPFRRILVFFNSTKSLQFHYALFKHFVLPNVKQILQGTAQDEVGGPTAYVSDASRCKSCSSDMRDSQGADDWPKGVPLPSLWALHSRLSAEKRRAVVDAFASDDAHTEAEGAAGPRRLKVLFCTDVAAVGVQLGPISFLLQVGVPKSVEVYVQRAARAPRLARKLLALSDLDGHFLYECYKECIPLREASAPASLPLLRPNRLYSKALGAHAETVAYRSAVERFKQQRPQPHADASGAPHDDATSKRGTMSSQSESSQPTATVLVTPAGEFESISVPPWTEVRPLRASCELMYRSLLGMYTMQASRLKFERWQVPSFINAILISMGVDEPFAVSKQMAARLQLMQAPGLTVNYHATSRTELLACLPSCPGFVSRYRELQAEGPLPADVSAAFNWGTEDELQGSPKRDRKPLMKEGSVPQLPSLKGSNNESSTDEQEVDSFARQTLYPSRVPWA